MTETTTAPPPTAVPPQLTQAEFGTEAIRRFGTLPDLWLFRCPLCGHVQSAADLPIERRTHVAQACFRCGFLAEQAAGPSLGRLWRVALPDGTVTDSFPLADAVDSGIGRPASQAPHGAVQDPDGTPGPERADRPPAPLSAPACAPPGPSDHTPLPSTPYLTGDDHAESES